MTRLKDHILVLRKNVTGSHLSISELEAAETYHVVVNTHSVSGHVASTYKGIVPTSKLMFSHKLLCDYEFMEHVM